MNTCWHVCCIVTLTNASASCCSSPVVTISSEISRHSAALGIARYLYRYWRVRCVSTQGWAAREQPLEMLHGGHSFVSRVYLGDDAPYHLRGAVLTP
ncbi:hypothetical protein CC86DRAFT_156337 [Ophiobolus disseminans]|uniref:Secreted protein n=1 Tax=Ophiobolus disseminans TaxID=1469910 RepID=A0A6A6ZDZ0_9PLEO|nr:hypothetical protein CC86DRAFT_156337 [Ophiobolus disseminans]